jgi:hypothetical protein
MKKYIGLFLVFAIVMSSCTKKVETVDDVIAKFVDKMGGKEKITNIKGMRLETEITIMSSVTAPLNVTIFKPDKFRMDVEVMGQKTIQCLNGQTAWLSQNGIVSPIQGEAIAQMKENMETQFKFLNNPIINYKENGLKVSLIGKDSVNGKAAYKLLSINKKGDSTYIFIDEKDLREVKNEVTVAGPNKEKTKLEFLFSDFKNISGIDYPHVISVKQDKNEVSKIIIKKIEILNSIDMKLFEMPQSTTPETPAPTGIN